MTERINMEEALLKAKKILGKYSDDREFTETVIKNDGWKDGVYDVHVFVQMGSPVKSIIVADKGHGIMFVINGDRVISKIKFKGQYI